jgi:hypothetical protein
MVISDFGKEILYSQENGESLMHPESFEDQRKNYQLYLSESRSKIFTVVKTKWLNTS